MSEYVITCDEETASWVGNDVDAMRPLVRCKDCRKHNNIHGQDWCKESAKYITPEDFCSWGERREQEPVEVWNQWSADDVTCSEES